jgi:hypothetical protein
VLALQEFLSGQKPLALFSDMEAEVKERAEDPVTLKLYRQHLQIGLSSSRELLGQLKGSKLIRNHVNKSGNMSYLH